MWLSESRRRVGTSFPAPSSREAIPEGVGAGGTTGERGEVLDVLRELLDGGRSDEVVELVRKLVVRNSDLERRLAQALGRGRKNEGVSKAQLLLLLDELARGEDAPARPRRRPSSPRPTRSCATRAASTIRAPTTRIGARASRGGSRRCASPRRRTCRAWTTSSPCPCPTASARARSAASRASAFSHDVTEVIELVPAQVIVRRDLHEKLACEPRQGSGDLIGSGSADLIHRSTSDGAARSTLTERRRQFG